MFTLKKLLTPFLLPPGGFIVLLIFSSLCFFFGRNRQAGTVNVLIACTMWALSLSPVTDVMVRWLESGLYPRQKPHGDVIVLMGGNLADTLERAVFASRLHRKQDMPIIVFDESAAGKKEQKEGFVRRILGDLGVPADDIISGPKSRDTFEDAKHARDICVRLGYKTPIIVTSAYHMRRSMMSFQKAGMEAVPFPRG